MKTVSLRDFQLKPSEYLDEPIAFTRYGKTISILLPIEYYEALSETSETKEVLTDVDREVSEDGKVKKSLSEPEKKTKYGWCEGHYEKDKDYNLRFISVDDMNGTEVLTKKWVCDTCIDKLESNISRYGGKIYFL